VISVVEKKSLAFGPAKIKERKKTEMKKMVYVTALSLAAGIFADTSMKASSGELHREKSWDNGLPSASNPGTIDIKGSWAVNGATVFADWVVTQKEGTISRSVTSITLNKGAKWRLEGGKIVCTDASSNKAHVRVGESTSGAELIMTGGEISADSYFDVCFESLFRQSGGTVKGAAGCRFSGGGKTFIEGGAGTFGTMSVINPGTQIEFSGGAWTASGTLNFGGTTTPDSFIRFAKGDGSLSVGGLALEGSGFIDFSAGSAGKFSVKNFKANDFEKLWSRGKIRFNASSRGNFADLFVVEKNTLKLK